MDVPDEVGQAKRVHDRRSNVGAELLDTGSTGRIVRSIAVVDEKGKAKRELVVPPELRRKYGLDD